MGEGMRRGFLTFLLVLAFLPAALELANIHSESVAAIEDTKGLLMEQQRVTNIEHDFESSFWMAAVQSAKKSSGLPAMERNSMLAEDIASWSRGFSAKHAEWGESVELWAGEAGIGYASEGFVTRKALESSAADYVSVNAGKNGGSAWVKRRLPSRAHHAIGATIRFGRTKSIYLIPGGSSHAV